MIREHLTEKLVFKQRCREQISEGEAFQTDSKWTWVRLAWLEKESGRKRGQSYMGCQIIQSVGDHFMDFGFDLELDRMELGVVLNKGVKWCDLPFKGTAFIHYKKIPFQWLVCARYCTEYKTQKYLPLWNWCFSKKEYTIKEAKTEA